MKLASFCGGYHDEQMLGGWVYLISCGQKICKIVENTSKFRLFFKFWDPSTFIRQLLNGVC